MIGSIEASPDCSQDFTAGAATLFVPERLTPLYYTPLYAQLPDAVRIRYNHLHGLFCFEMVAFFERFLPEYLRAVQRSVPLTEETYCGISSLIEDEARHYEIFYAELTRLEPRLYKSGKPLMVYASGPERMVRSVMLRSPRILPFLVWLIIMQEEKGVSLSKEAIADPAVSPRIKEIHRRHLADEGSHRVLSSAMIREIWDPMPHLLKRANVHLLAWVVRTFFWYPRQGSRRVVDQLRHEYRGLDILGERCSHALEQLTFNGEYKRMQYSLENIPETLQLMRERPEFRGVYEVFQ